MSHTPTNDQNVSCAYTSAALDLITHRFGSLEEYRAAIRKCAEGEGGSALKQLLAATADELAALQATA